MSREEETLGPSGHLSRVGLLFSLPFDYCLQSVHAQANKLSALKSCF